MTDRLTPSQRSALMARIRRSDTKPEIAVRRLLHGLGYRFRVQLRASRAGRTWHLLDAERLSRCTAASGMRTKGVRSAGYRILGGIFG